MATFTPKELVAPAAITTTPTTVYTATGVTAIIRTFQFMVLTTTHRVFLKRETGFFYVNDCMVTPDYAEIYNGHIVLPDTKLIQVYADSIATNAPNFGAWGYEYS